MLFKKSLICFVFILCIVLAAGKAVAQPFSYVYIQGDRETPFYVKLEDQMQPRYGKNYCIISQLAAGIINVQILFQQNAYPPQKFTIIVPDNSYRGFLLTRKGSTFSLYDLQQQFYLPAGNSAADDHSPVNNPANNYIATTKTITAPVVAEPVAAAVSETPVATQPATQTAVQQAPETVTASAPTETKAAAPDQPKFIDNIELNNERTVQPASTVPASTSDDLANDVSANRKPSVINSDCPAPMSDDEYDALYKKVTDRSDKTRLKYLLGRMDECFTTEQVRLLTKTLSNDPERYALLKQAYSRITDQANFSSLENLLSTQEWKSYFRLIIP